MIPIGTELYLLWALSYQIWKQSSQVGALTYQIEALITHDCAQTGEVGAQVGR